MDKKEPFKAIISVGDFFGELKLKWNDAKTSLPAESGRYLGYMGKTDIYRYDHAAKKFYREEGDSQSETPCVVHYWMELPLAPKAA